jgi:hypothetical protein
VLEERARVPGRRAGCRRHRGDCVARAKQQTSRTQDEMDLCNAAVFSVAERRLGQSLTLNHVVIGAVRLLVANCALHSWARGPLFYLSLSLPTSGNVG